MEQSMLRLVLGTLAEHSESCQSYPYSQYPNRQLFDPRVVDCSAPTNLLDVSSYVSTLALPTPLSHELNSLLEDDLNKDRLSIEQAYRRLLEQLSTTTTSPDPSVVPSHVRAALDAFCQRLINSRMTTIKQEIEAFKIGDDSESESDGSAESDEESACSEEDEAEELPDADEDDNAPVRPGEDIPPLDTKYLPIFEALHERGKVLTKPEKTYLVEMTGMTYRQITIWFQNRRRGELKEDIHARGSSSRAASVHSDQTTDASEDELELERRFSSIQPETTFNIRSWCLESAAATKDAGVQPMPMSPSKFGFGVAQAASGLDSDDGSDLSDSDDEMDAPPGLKAPSLTTSFTTVDSGSERGPATVASGSSRVPNSQEGPIIMGDSSSSAFRRPVKPLPPSRRTSPQVRGQPVAAQQTPAFSFNLSGPTSAPTQNQFPPMLASAPVQPPQFVTSNERGLTVEMDTTPPSSTATLRPSPSPSAPSAPTSFANTSMPVVLPSSPPASTGSPRSASSPTPSAQCTSSPRPAVKPLPRRTGCAPRPRPPPRAGSASTPAAASAATPSSTRSSVVLPPSSNPSLGNTTLGALLRPNPPAPKIPTEMEERLSAMAGRMGVGANSNPARRSISTDMTARSGVSPSSAPPARGSSFSFGFAALPGTNTLPGSTLASITEQQAQGSASRSPTS